MAITARLPQGGRLDVDDERSARMYEGPSVLGKTMEPAPDLQVEHPRQIFNGLAAAQMQLLVPNLRPYRLARLVCNCRTEVADVPPPTDYATAGSETYTPER
jgi:hypothetical protein